MHQALNTPLEKKKKKLIKFNKVSTNILSGLGGLIGAQSRRRDRNERMDAGKSLEICFQIWTRPSRGKRLELRDRVETADEEPSGALERVGSARRQAGVGERELTWRGGRRRTPQPFRFRRLSSAHMGRGLGEGGGGEGGQVRSRGGGGGGRPKEMRQPFPPTDSGSSSVCGARCDSP